ncbi:hypothetical protein ARV1_gp20 [Acidianus rod-shaped virus 1]|uniref:Uncharacterized protein n=1 Tax=Acidianus rod-shaped virus 1 TaxID=309181 RepID=Q50I51_9VIRU|nr:hypothetical protein ARV1_gp20 [Acidianus rod-shaped virus 1]CAI44175.1 hypothetical protein [Acidianus rod-shaped virus 1]
MCFGEYLHMSITYASISDLLAKPFQRLTSSMWNAVVLELNQVYFGGSLIDRKLFVDNNLYVPQNLFAMTGDFYNEVYVAGQPVLTEQDPIYIAGFISTAYNQISAILASQQQLYTAISNIPHSLGNIAYPLDVLYRNLQSIQSGFYGILQQFLYQTAQNFNVFLGELYKLSESPVFNEWYTLYNTNAILQQALNVYLPKTLTTLADTVIYDLFYMYLATATLANAINKLTVYLSPSSVQGLSISVGQSPAPIYSGPALQTVKIILQNLSNYIIYIGNSIYNNFPILPNNNVEFRISNPANVYAWSTGPATVYALFEVT